MLYITDIQVSERYQIARSTVWKWVKEGRLPMPVKIGGSTRWRIADLEQWESKK